MIPMHGNTPVIMYQVHFMILCHLLLPDGTTRQYHSGWDTDYPVGLDGKIKPDAKRLWNFDQYDFMFSHRLKQEYGISAAGAMNEKNKYYVSMGYLNDKGAYIGDDYARYQRPPDP